MRGFGRYLGGVTVLALALAFSASGPAAAQRGQGGLGIGVPSTDASGPRQSAHPGAVALPPGLQTRLSPAHAKELAEFDTARAEAIAVARTRPTDDAEQRAAIATLEKVLQGELLPVTDKELIGPWRCRSIQADSLGVYAYTFFRCRVTPATGGLGFHKFSGSQRKLGELQRLDDKRLAYLGAVYYERDAIPKGYGNGSERDEIGQLSRVGTGRVLLEIIGPQQSIEIIELVR